MKSLNIIVFIGIICWCSIACSFAEQNNSSSPKKTAVKANPENIKADSLVVIARLTEIPGKFPANDLYNYVYIMKYRIVKVVKGEYKGQDILVGEYNPRIARSQIKDKMDQYVNGDVSTFTVGDVQKLVLITPMEKVWKDAVEDEYFDSDLTKYFAVSTDKAK